MLILRSADMLKLFDMVFVMTRGGPGAATELISVYIQRVGFKVFDLGMASAQACPAARAHDRPQPDLHPFLLSAEIE